MTDTTTDAPGASGTTTPALPAELFRHWIHSREEDQRDERFFRGPDFVFPPSFGRDGMEMQPDGGFVQHDLGPADGIVRVPGHWTQEAPDRIAVRFGGRRPDYAFALVDVRDDLLRIRLQEQALHDGPARDLAQRTRIRAFRADRYVLVVAEGNLPTPGFEVDITRSPMRIFPPRYDLVRRELPGVWPDVLTPFSYSELVVFPADQPAVTVHHADGQDEVGIEESGHELAGVTALIAPPSGAGEVAEAVGMSAALSFDEAFRKAVDNLPATAPPHPDALTTVTVEDIRGMFGGIAGFHHLVVRVRGSAG